MDMQKTFLFKNTAVHYRVEGAGIPVVLLHGFGEDSHIFDSQADYLKLYCKIIIPDLPGSGESRLPATQDNNPAFYESIDDFADCIHRLFEEEGINAGILLGHSMGGYITLAFAEKYPALLLGFGLIHSTAFPDNEEKKANRIRGIGMIGHYGAGQFLRTTIPNLFSQHSRETFPGIMASLMNKASDFSKEALIVYYTAMMNRPDRTQVLKESAVPVLFIVGREDVAAPLKDLEQQFGLPECSYFHILDQTGHMGMLEATGATNGYLLDFINRIKK